MNILFLVGVTGKGSGEITLFRFPGERVYQEPYLMNSSSCAQESVRHTFHD